MTRLLIVDDHVHFRSTARKLLVAGGFDVVGEVGDGAGALEAVARLHPDIVLLDVQLPDANGFELSELLARNGGSPVVILTSSRDSKEFGGLLSRSHARGFIPKAELSVATVRALLG